MKNLLSIILVLALLNSCQTSEKKKDKSSTIASNQNDVSNKSESKELKIFLQHYEDIFKTQFYGSRCPGAAVAIVKDSSIIYLKGFGIKSVNSSDSINVNTVFRIASLSKGFTAVLVSILVDRGILNWNDKVVDYVPYFALKNPEQTQRIQIKHLLSHSTGLPRHSLIELIEDGQAMEQMIPKLKRVKLEGKEGEFFGYQNTTFSIIQEIIKIKTTKSLEQWIKDEIFLKAGMKNASMSYQEIMDESNKSMPHERKSNGEWKVREIHSNYYNTAAASGINASISDMANWLLVLLGNRPDITPPGSLDFIFTPFINHEGLNYFESWSGVTKSGYGMGWRVLEYHGHKVVCHGGYVNDYRAEIAVDFNSKIGVCFLFNAQTPYSNIAVPNFLETYYLYEELTSPK
jgi:beta-lactamase class C